MPGLPRSRGQSGQRSPKPSVRTVPRRPSAWCPTWPRPASPTGSTCADRPTRSTRPARRRWSPSTRRSRSWRADAATRCSPAACTTATTSRSGACSASSARSPRSGRIRPFHRDADGILIGEGTGVVVLKRLEDALAAGDRVYAVIRGTGVASDGRAASLFNPEPAGQVRAVRRPGTAAGLDPRAADALGLLEAHGTATPAGDAAELATLAEVFGPPGRRAADRPRLGQVDDRPRHARRRNRRPGQGRARGAPRRAAADAALRRSAPGPEGDAVRAAGAGPALAAGGAPRRAGVNAFGFGGDQRSCGSGAGS